MLEEDGMKFVAGLFGGLLFAILGDFVVAVIISAVPEPNESISGITLIILWIIGFVIAFKAERPAKAWRRLLISSAIITFLIPIAGFINSTIQVVNSDGTDSAEVIGMFVGGGLALGFFAVLSFFLGGVLLIVGLLVGRDKKVPSI